MKVFQSAAAFIAAASILASTATQARPRFVQTGRSGAILVRPAPAFGYHSPRRPFYPADAPVGVLAVVGAVAAIAAIASEPPSNVVCRRFFTWDGRPFDRCVPAAYVGY